MWINEETFEIMSDDEMGRIFETYDCEVTDFGRTVRFNNTIWKYDERRNVDVL